MLRSPTRFCLGVTVGLSVAIVGSPVCGGTFTSKAVDREGNPIPEARVVVLNEQGIPLNPRPSAYNRATGLHRVEVNNEVLERAGTNNVTLRFLASGYETLTFTRILGTTDQRIDVVLPKSYGGGEPSPECSSAPTPAYPMLTDAGCCPPPCKRRLFRWRR